MPKVPERNPSHSPPTFSSLRSLLPRILAHLQRLQPAKCLLLSQSLYEELFPAVYERVILDENNVSSFFYGFFTPPPSWEQGGRGAGAKRKRLPPFPHLPAPEWLLPPITSPTHQFSRGRKSVALGYTTHITLLDPMALSILCAARATRVGAEKGGGGGAGDGEGWKGGVKRFLKEAIYELAGEWELDTLELVIPPREVEGVYIPVFDGEDEEEGKYPPPAKKVVINFSHLSQPGTPYEQATRVRAYLEEAGEDGFRGEFKLKNALEVRRVVGDVGVVVKGFTFVEG